MTVYDHPVVKKAVYYWAYRYGRGNPAVFGEILGEGYLAVVETVTKYPDLPMEDVVRLARQAVGWKVKSYFSYGNRAGRDKVIVDERIEGRAGENRVEQEVDLKIQVDRMEPRRRGVVVQLLRGYSMVEIGRVLGVSKQRVFQIVRGV